MPNICEIDFVALVRIFQIPQKSKFREFNEHVNRFPIFWTLTRRSSKTFWPSLWSRAARPKARNSPVVITPLLARPLFLPAVVLFKWVYYRSRVLDDVTNNMMIIGLHFSPLGPKLRQDLRNWIRRRQGPKDSCLSKLLGSHYSFRKYHILVVV